MASSVTIDNYDLTAHERWAKDQAALEPVFIHDSGHIPAHLNVATLEKSLLSKWEELFELNSQRHTFAHFSTPPQYALMRNRFFTHAISEEFDWTEEEENEEGQREKEQRQAERYKEMIQKTKKGSMPVALFEKERSHLLNLIDSIQLLNGFMREIHGRKLQYQKG